MHARARNREIRKRRRALPRESDSRHPHPARDLCKRSISATVTRIRSTSRISPTARMKACCSCERPARCSINSANLQHGRVATPETDGPLCARFANEEIFDMSLARDNHYSLRCACRVGSSGHSDALRNRRERAAGKPIFQNLRFFSKLKIGNHDATGHHF